MSTWSGFVSIRWWLVNLCLSLFLPLQVLAQVVPENAGQNAAQNAAQGAGQDVAQNAAQDAAQNAAQNAVRNAGQDGYSAEVAVNGQSQNEQLSAYRVAMRIILLKNSGDKSLLNDPEIQRALIEADNYIDSSSYRIPGSEDRITRATPLTPKVRQSNQATHLLMVQFNPGLLNGLIADQSAPAAEPDPDAEPVIPTSALLWLLIDDGNGEHRIGGPTGTNVIDRVREIGGGVGQRLVFPEQDALDLQALSVLDLQSGDQQRVLGASRRYQESVVLVGALKRVEGRSWTALWTRYYLGTTVSFNDTAASLDQALQQGIRWLAVSAQPPGSLATEEAPASVGFTSPGAGFGRNDNSDSGTIWVSSLRSIEGYAGLMELINEIESVELVYPAEVLPSGVLFSVTPRYALNDVSLRLSGVPWLRPAVQGGSPLEQTTAAQPLARVDITYEFVR